MLSIWAILIVCFALAPLLSPLHFVGRTGFVTIYALFLVGYLAAKYDAALLNWPRALAIIAFVSTLMETA